MRSGPILRGGFFIFRQGFLLFFFLAVVGARKLFSPHTTLDLVPEHLSFGAGVAADPEAAATLLVELEREALAHQALASGLVLGTF
jgi:hypothetical protein